VRVRVRLRVRVRVRRDPNQVAPAVDALQGGADHDGDEQRAKHDEARHARVGAGDGGGDPAADLGRYKEI